MANAKKCDRCGKLFEPYLKFDEEDKDQQEFIKLLVMHANLDNKQNPSENVYVDLCNECYESFSKWLEKPKVVKHEHNEATKENGKVKQKGCNVFGAFDGSIDCLMCPQCDECREVTNSIKEASSNGE